MKAMHAIPLALILLSFSGIAGCKNLETESPKRNTSMFRDYKLRLGRAYLAAWTIPDSIAVEAADIRAAVTIVPDGTVISARLTKPSGNRVLDDSVQRTLDRVRFIAPFPEGARDSQRTFTINFNLKAKKAIG